MIALISMFLPAGGPATLGMSSSSRRLAEASGTVTGFRAVAGAEGGDTTSYTSGISSSSSFAGQSCSHSEWSEKSDCHADSGLGERGIALKPSALPAASDGLRVRGCGRAARSGSNNLRRGLGSRWMICVALASSLGSSH